jgi:homoserine dehydrogenase
MRADILLVGFGNVGRRFARLLIERQDVLQRQHDLETHIIGVATGRHGSAFAPQGLDVGAMLQAYAAGRRLSDDPTEAGRAAVELIARLGASDAPLRVLVETTPLAINDGQPAISHIEAALAAGCDAVTANKGPVAFAYRRLREHASRVGRSFLFEGAVMDGVPIFNLVRETMPVIEVKGLRGVVNSTTNHILSALEVGEAFAPALARMQVEGIAEADPSLDIDGWDAAAKTAALANVLMDADLTPSDVERSGISTESAAQALRARQNRRRLRLVASASRTADGGVSASVRPQELPDDDLLAQLRGKSNALILQTDLLGEIAITQLGGDVTMTAYALLSDLVTLRRTVG